LPVNVGSQKGIEGEIVKMPVGEPSVLLHRTSSRFPRTSHALVENENNEREATSR
jgi:hypothetical protein